MDHRSAKERMTGLVTALRAADRRRGADKAAVALMLAVIGLAGGVAVAAPASASTVVGQIDVQRACDQQYPALGLQAKALNRNDPYSWRCVVRFNTSMYGVDLNRACQKQYGVGAYQWLANPRDAYSWRCVR